MVSILIINDGIEELAQSRSKLIFQILILGGYHNMREC